MENVKFISSPKLNTEKAIAGKNYQSFRDLLVNKVFFPLFPVQLEVFKVRQHQQQSSQLLIREFSNFIWEILMVQVLNEIFQL